MGSILAKHLTEAEARAIVQTADRAFPQKRLFVTMLTNEPDGWGVKLGWGVRSNRDLRTYLLGAVDAINAARLLKVTAEHAAIMARLDEHAKAINRQTEAIQGLNKALGVG